LCHDDCATVSSARRGNDDRCSSSLFDWYLCISAKKSSSGTVGALAVTDAAPPVTDGSALRCSSIRAPYRTTVIKIHLTDALFFGNNHRLTKPNNNNTIIMSMYIRYDTTEEFHVDSKAECDQFNRAHVARNKKSIKKKLKQTPVPT